MSTKKALKKSAVKVIPFDDGRGSKWAVRREGNSKNTLCMRTQEDAYRRAYSYARTHKVELVLCNSDGTERSRRVPR